MDRYVDRNGKNIGRKDEKMLQVLSAMSKSVPTTEERAERMVERIKEIKGVKDIGDPDYIELKEFGRNAKYGLTKTADKVTVNPKTQEEIKNSLKMDEREKLAYEKAQIKTPKEAEDVRRGKKLEEVEPQKKSKEVGDNATKNVMKKKKQAERDKLEGISL